MGKKQKIRDRFLKIGMLTVLLLAALIFISCSSTPIARRGSLSGAMEKSQDDYPGTRIVPKEFEEPESVWPPVYDGDYGSSSQPDYSTGESLPLEPLKLWVGARGGNALNPANDIGTWADVDMTIGGDLSENLGIYASAGIKAAYPVAGSALDASIADSLLFAKADLEGRFTPFARWPVLSPYFFAGFGGFIMAWTFQNPLYSGGDTISSDSLQGFSVSAGAGVYLLNLEHLRIGLCAVPELYVFGSVTQEGFKNDYFGTFESLKIVGEVSVLF